MNSMKPKPIFILVLVLVITVNLAESFVDILGLYSKRQNNPFFFSGSIFLGLEKMFQDVKYVGYYTDKNLNERPTAAKFAQAQYILAPAILDLNATDHEFILFDCSREEIARRKIEDIKAVPLKKNKFGVILAKKSNNAPTPNDNSQKNLSPDFRQ